MSSLELMFFNIIQMEKMKMTKREKPKIKNQREVNFKPPFVRISLIKGIEDALNIKIPSDLNSEETRLFLLDVCKKNNIDCPEPKQQLDYLIDLLENTLNQRWLIQHSLLIILK